MTMSVPKLRSVGLVLAGALLAACGGVDGSLDEIDRAELADLGQCPDPLVIQTDWYPRPEYGALYNLTGGEGRIEADSGRFQGPLAADPSLTVEIRSGGPLVGFRPPVDLMVADADVFLAMVSTDEAIAHFEQDPTTAVVAPLDVSPQMVMWDPETYDIESWTDLRGTGALVSHVARATYPDYLLGAGLVLADQLEASYDGSPTRFVAEDGAVMQEGYATYDPAFYRSPRSGWGRPVEYLLVHDAGYELYRGALAVLDERLDEAAEACLAAFVPLVQQSIVDFQRDPRVATETLLEALSDFEGGWELTAEEAADAVIEMGALDVVGNGPNNTIGDFDLGRVDEVIVETVERVSSIEVPLGLTSADVVTNRFIDPAIGL